MKLANILATLVLCSTLSCTWIKTVPNNPVVADVIDCAKEAVASTAQAILGKVTTILATGGTSWRDELTSLAISKGEEALACAVEQVTKDFTEKAEAAPNARNSITGAVNGRTFLDEKGYKFAAGQ